MDLQQVPAVAAAAAAATPHAGGGFLGGWDQRSATPPTSALAAAAMAARYAVVPVDFGSTSTDDDGGGAAVRFRRAVYRVLIALSFKSFRRRNETKRRRERSDCSEARFLPAAVPTPVEDDTLAPEDDIQYVAAVRRRL